MASLLTYIFVSKLSAKWDTWLYSSVDLSADYAQKDAVHMAFRVHDSAQVDYAVHTADPNRNPAPNNVHVHVCLTCYTVWLVTHIRSVWHSVTPQITKMCTTYGTINFLKG